MATRMVFLRQVQCLRAPGGRPPQPLLCVGSLTDRSPWLQGCRSAVGTGPLRRASGEKGVRAVPTCQGLALQPGFE